MALPMVDAQENPKSKLIIFLQRFVGRTMTKGDIIYNSVELGEGHWQSVLTLACSQGETFQADGPGEKEAGQAAAQLALDHFATEIAAMPPALTKAQKKSMRNRPGKDPSQVPVGVPGGFSEGLNVGMDLGLGAPQAPGPESHEGNFKTKLVIAIQGYTKKALTRGDVTYESLQIGEMWQATCTLNCLGGLAFNGEATDSEKASEHSAAEQALLASDSWMPAALQVAQEVAQSAPVPAAVRPPKQPQTQLALFASEPRNPKSELVMFIQGYMKRSLTKEDIVYTHTKGEGLTQATVTLNCCGGQQFAGEPMPVPKDAEKSAADEALKGFATEVNQMKALARTRQPVAQTMTTLVNPGQGASFLGGPPAKKPRITSPAGAFQMQGTAGLGGLGGALAQGVAQQPALAGLLQNPAIAGLLQNAGLGGALGGLGGGVAGATQGRAPARGRKGGGVGAGPRQKVTTEPVLGEVVEWNAAANWGYVRPHAPINHPKEKMREGKIYVHKQDLVNAPALQPGSLIQFHVYADGKGLGASEVLLF